MGNAVRLVEEYRGGVLENIYGGHICGVDDKGRVILAAGDPDWVTHMRSAAKPIQAIPAFMHGCIEAFGLTDREAALMMASHRAEHYHVEALESMMRKIGIDDSALVCAPSLPLSPAARDDMLLRQMGKRKLYHNCSGKHMGILAYCKKMGYPLDGYNMPEHPAQLAIGRAVEEMSGCPAERIRMGVDGCGLPVFALPLRYMAAMYMRLACPDRIASNPLKAAAARIAGLMNAHSEMISAPWFICSTLLGDSNIVAKGGAKGVYCFGLRRERIAFALKVLDGSEDKWPYIIAGILEQIGYGNRETIDKMYALAPRELRNDSGDAVGLNKAVFQLKAL
jgi:L-asparaginase II